MSSAQLKPLAVAGMALLAAVLVLHVVTLTTAPPLFGDEAWVGSKLQSLVAGNGFHPSMGDDYGIYGTGTDYYAARIGSIPQVVGAYLGPETFTFERIVSFGTALAALGVFWFGLRRVHGPNAATFGAGALATTWGFFTASHWIRFDPMGLLVAAAVLAILLSGPPSARTCLGLGLLLGISSDWAYPLMGVVPGVALLAIWEPGERWKKLGLFAAGLAVGLAVFYGIHVLPNPDAANHQYDTQYEPSYGQAPLIEMVKQGSLQPLFDESDRYELLLQSTFRPSVITLLIGLVGAAIVLLRVRGIASRALSVAGFAAIGVGLLAMFVHHLGDFYLDHPGYLDAIRYAVLALILAGVAGIAWLFLKDRPAYPPRAVAAVLLVSQLVGLGLLQQFKLGTSTDWPLVYAVATLVAAAELLVSEGRRQVAVAAVMTVLTFAGATYMLESLDDAPEQPALDDEVARVANEVVPEGRTVMGEQAYYWLYGDERFRANTTIWFLEYTNPGFDFQEAFHKANPDYVLLDDTWLARYPNAALFGSAASFWPNEAPDDPAEQGQLMQLLQAEYRPVRTVDYEGNNLVFWERKDLQS